MANETPDNPEILLRRRDASAALMAAGYPTAESTLATMATRGGGPEYRTFGRTVLYRWGDLLAWAESRMSKPHRSTSERDNRSAA